MRLLALLLCCCVIACNKAPKPTPPQNKPLIEKRDDLPRLDLPKAHDEFERTPEGNLKLHLQAGTTVEASETGWYGVYTERITWPPDDVYNRALYPEGKGKLPANAETKALLYLKPYPSGYYGPMPEEPNTNFEDFKYLSHECHPAKEQMADTTDGTLPEHVHGADGIACTACYDPPEGYVGRLSVWCPLTQDRCYLLFLDAEGLADYGISSKACEPAKTTI